jgi:hypothetical protein
VTILTQEHRHFPLRLVLYDEDETLGLRIAVQVEEDPRCELIALCTTLGDLNFILNRVTVDVLLLHLTPNSCDRVLSVASGPARDVPLLVLFHSCHSYLNRAPTCRTAKDIMGTEAYRWFDRIESSDERSQCNTLA